MAYFDIDRRTSGLMSAGTGSIGPGAPGPKSTGEYIVSGIPFVKFVTQDGNTNEITFPQLTQWIIVTNHGGAAMKLGFTSTGVDSNSNYFQIASGATTPKLEVRTKSVIYDGTATNTFSIIASLTGVLTGSVPDYATSTYWGV